MHSYLLVSDSKEKVLEKLEEIVTEEKVDKADFSIFEDEKTFGIDTFRAIKERIFLKPARSKNKIVALDLFRGVTTEAQNAMLKVLEEPPSSTIMILLGRKKDNFLPTILSRVQIIEIKEQSEEGDGKEIEEILASGTGKKMVSAQNLSKDKEEAIKFLKGSVLYLRNKMQSEVKNGEDAQKTIDLIKRTEKAYYTISETNINPRMTLENLFLGL